MLTPTCVGKSTSGIRLHLHNGSPPRVWGNPRLDRPAIHAMIRFTPTWVGKSPVSAVIARYRSRSPPRVWGNHTADLVERARRRFTPSCAGKSRDERSAWHDGPPPLCGEIGLETARLGESRFTPTCVGKSRGQNVSRPPAVHPHVCGEISDESRTAFSRGGSPPCVGKSSLLMPLPSVAMRFTPTCVGKSRSIYIEWWTNGVGRPPPRVWGNRRRVARCSGTTRGSPPRVWGNPVPPFSGAPVRCGSPPRVWGNPTRQATLSHRSIPVHPHVCGEIPCFEARHQKRGKRFTPTCVGKSRLPRHRCQFARGSPPRVWGNRQGVGCINCSLARFTPTCVGKSHHPQASASRVRHGSPPRVWGNRLRGRTAACACAVHPHVCGEICPRCGGTDPLL